MRLSEEARMVHLWQREPRPGDLELRALEAFVDAHIANPRLDYGEDEYRMVKEYAGGAKEAQNLPGMGAVEALLRRKKALEGRKVAKSGEGGALQLMVEAGLTEREMRAMELAGAYGGNLREIARNMGLARATVETKIERGREKIQRYLRRQRNGQNPGH